MSTERCRMPSDNDREEKKGEKLLMSSSLPPSLLPSSHCLFLPLPHFFSSVSVPLSINPRAEGVMLLVFPPGDTGLYRKSLTLEGS